MKHEELDAQLDSFGDALASATRVTPGNALRPEDIAVGGVKPSDEVAQYALTLGDDALILAQRMSHWISRAPELEEDVALGNIALDVLGHARSFLTYAGLAWDKTEDDLAYWREEEEFTSLWIVEQPNGHFGVTIIRQLIVSIFQNLLYKQLTQSKDETLVAISAKAVKEVDYHRDHAIQWTIRLGQGTEESAAKMRHALEILWPYVDEMFRDEAVHQNLQDIAVLPSTLRAAWEEEITAVLADAGLEIPDTGQAMAYGRRGEHSEHLGYLLAEMQVLARKHPGASW
ncbi:1,2-phenylacetyl-CoA epoxidase subunit PaaC [Glutamicibacter arilaitensis]|uniref:1,2-phenylacetyl-CoA epoxidase subunit PaaC n=1 Tax=Glutamicibacter arilaitensis TaxID=256701 RepID=UPI003FD2DA69